MFFSPVFLYETYVVGTHWQVDAIQMGTHNICLYKEEDKKYTSCNLKTMELLDCALIGACAVIRSNKVFYNVSFPMMQLIYICVNG